MQRICCYDYMSMILLNDSSSTQLLHIKYVGMNYVVYSLKAKHKSGAHRNCNNTTTVDGQKDIPKATLKFGDGGATTIQQGFDFIVHLR